MNREMEKLRRGDFVLVFNPNFLSPSLMAKGARWLTIHAKTMLGRGTKDLLGLPGNNNGRH